MGRRKRGGGGRGDSSRVNERDSLGRDGRAGEGRSNVPRHNGRPRRSHRPVSPSIRQPPRLWRLTNTLLQYSGSHRLAYPAILTCSPLNQLTVRFSSPVTPIVHLRPPHSERGQQAWILTATHQPVGALTLPSRFKNRSTRRLISSTRMSVSLVGRGAQRTKSSSVTSGFTASAAR